ncbi:MAG: spore maturation protein [Clostridia bacterium]|nr:spore maturation protein [Clostridia bacterium]
MSAIVPIGIVLLLLYAVLCRVRIFSAFLEGAERALLLLKKLIPCLAGMLVAITVFRDSGALDALTRILRPVTDALGVDARLLPLILMRPLSGSAAIAVLSDLFTEYGPDSVVGKTGSVLLGASETLLYSLALYFGSVGIRKTRFAVPLALFASIVSVVAGLVFSRLFFG